MAERRNPIERRTLLRPVAAPVDSFVAPPRPSPRSDLRQLAQGLGTFNRELGDFLEERRRKDEAEQALRGEAAFIRSNQVGFAEGVRRGLIPSHASPAFVNAYKKAEGRAAGFALQQKFQAEFMAMPVETRTDPQAFDTFFQDFLEKNITTDDPAALAGLLPQVRILSQNAQVAATADRHKTIYNASVQAHAALGAQIIDRADNEGLARQEGTDYSGLYDSLMGVREDALASGIRSSDIDEQVVDLVVAKAVELQDPALLGVLDRPVPGESFAFSDTPTGRDAKLGAEEKLERIAIRQLAEQEESDKEEAKRRKDEATVAILRQLAEDPKEPIPEAAIRAGERYIPDLRARLPQWQRTLSGAPALEDEAEIARVQEALIEGGGLSVVLRAIDDGTIRNASTMRTMFNFVRTRDDAGGPDAKVLKGGTLTLGINTIIDRTSPDARRLDLNPFSVTGLSNDGLRAVFGLKAMLLEWAQANPDASLAEVERAQQEHIALILAGIETERGEGLGTGPSSPGQVILPEAAERAFGDQSLLRVKPIGPLPADPEERAFIEGLSQDNIAAIAKAAEAEGIAADEFMHRMFLRQQSRGEAPQQETSVGAEAPEAGSEAPGLLSPEEGETLQDFGTRLGEVGNAVGESAVAVALLVPGETEAASSVFEETHTQPISGPTNLGAGIRGDDRANTILDLVGLAEAPGGYNQRVGDPADRPSHPDLTSMTLNEVALLPAVEVGGVRSTASGRYQFTAPTLVRLMGALGLTGEELFTPAMQDRLAYALLVQNGYLQFRNGLLSDEDFANALAKEWAGLPLVAGPSAGRSVFEGVGPNRATVSIEEVLNAVRGGM